MSTSVVTPNPDAPRCPACNYDLTALSSPRCPECGHPLPADRTPLRPSQRSSPWSPTAPPSLFKGIPLVLRHPIRTLSLANDPTRVSTSRALLFAALCLLPLIPLWNPIRNIGDAVAYIFSTNGIGDRLGIFRYQLPRDLSSFSRWFSLAEWEAVSLIRWLLFFIVLSLLPAYRIRLSFASRLRALCLFAPWLVLLELLYLLGVWLANAEVVPEPSTLWASDTAPWRDILSDPILITRTLLAVPFIATLFLRSALRWRFTLAIPVSLLLSPLAAMWSCIFTTLYIYLFLN